MTINITNGDCLKLMKELPDKSIDLFICDLPYGETNCKWDSVIDLNEFWKEFKRLRKSKKTACIHFCSTKFGYSLIKSNENMFKMDMVWKKRNKTGGLQSRYRPMRNHEMVYFFYEQAPKYNRDKYHKRIQAKPKIEKSETAIFSLEPECKVNFGTGKNFEPPNPLSVIEEDQKYKFSKDEKCVYGMNKKENTQGTNSFEPPNPASVLEEKVQEKEGRKKYKNTIMGDIYLKKEVGAVFDPPNPASVVEETDIYGETKEQMKARGKGHYHAFEPPNPASVVEEKDEFGWDKSVVKEKGTKFKGSNFEPPNPASVVEEKVDERINEKGKSGHGWDIEHMDKPRVAHFEPKLPVSILEEKHEWDTDVWGNKKYSCGGDCGLFNEDGTRKGKYEPPNPASVLEEKDDKWIKEVGKNGHGWDKHKPEYGNTYQPPNPVSVVEEEFIEPAEDEPVSMYESKKVFIGKRHHQTEKPLDILEFFIKYWSDEGHTILDPTMGSGSTGVACKSLKRNFIGFELDKKIFKVAENRINKTEVII